MNKLFPDMCSKPRKSTIAGLVSCWLWVFVALPLSMPFIGFGIWEQAKVGAWLAIGFYISNGIILLLVMHRYLADEWFMVITDVRFYLKHIALTVGLMVAAVWLMMRFLPLYGIQFLDLLNSLPVAEMTVNHTPVLLVLREPIFGTMALSVFTPFTICALFYCMVFAPVCCKKPWLAYVCVAVIALSGPVVNILWRGDVQLELSGYLLSLPIHLLACWSYQKTDNVWTPLISLAITNLLTSLALILRFSK